MREYEIQYMENLDAIRCEGVAEMNKRTGIATRRLPATQIIVDLEEEFPILLSKKVNWKTAVDEILWIIQKQSNRVSELNSHIWDNWAGEDGTIGKSYGYQVDQKVTRDGITYDNQVQYVLETLQRDPSNRQCVINMWNVAELGEMNLVPCVYSSIWNIIDSQLNCMLVQRSADYPVGVPFDTTQYAVLVHLFARHLGVKPGILTHVMADSHIYENQIEGVRKQFEQYRTLVGNRQYKELYGYGPVIPKLVFKEDAPTNFWQVKLEDMDVIDYEPMPAIKYEVAV